MRVQGQPIFVVASIVAIGVAAACLPDLEVTPPSPPPFCGDGTIDPDAGEECDLGDGGAGTKGCASCKVACAFGTAKAFVDRVSNHCYFSAGQQASTSDATSVCGAEGAHIVRFVSLAEMTLVGASSPTENFWVGLQRETALGAESYLPISADASAPTPEPGWAPGCPGCYAIPAGSAIPRVDGGKGGEECVVAKQETDQPWHRSDCAVAKAAAPETICEREPPGLRSAVGGLQVVSLTTAATEGRKRYVLLATRLAAGDAAQTCADNGGRLVVLESREEREQLAREIAAQTSIDGRDFWIGLATDANGAWAWDGAGSSNAGATLAPGEVWGLGQPQLDAGAGRAFVVIAPGAVDSELARAGDATDAGAEQHYVVCQL